MWAMNASLTLWFAAAGRTRFAVCRDTEVGQGTQDQTIGYIQKSMSFLEGSSFDPASVDGGRKTGRSKDNPDLDPNRRGVGPEPKATRGEASPTGFQALRAC